MEPIFVADLLPGLYRELVELLRGLSEEDWSRRATPKWSVRDVAAHLLDVSLRTLSFRRDGLRLPPPEIGSYADLVGYLDRLNADWVAAAQRLSPRVLTEMLALGGPQVAAHLASLDPFAPALFSVAWAGEEESPNWFDIARDYTEIWHHQMQIRGAVGAPGLIAREWLHPLLDISVRALPHAWREVSAEDGTAVWIEVTGEAGGSWSLVRRDGTWELFRGEPEDPACRVTLSDDTAWRLLYNALPPDRARVRIAVTGESTLAEPLLRARSVMVV
jgi:uncharacterized protein (TIGR03083 family)